MSEILGFPRDDLEPSGFTNPLGFNVPVPGLDGFTILTQPIEEVDQ